MTPRINSMISLDQKALFDQMPTASGCKDLNSTFVYANQEYAKIVGLDHSSDVQGRSDYDMPCDTTKCAKMFRAQDQVVIESGEIMRILDIHPFSGGNWRAYIFSKSPLKNIQGKIVGTIFNGQDITNASTLELGSLLAKTKIEDVPGELTGQDSYMLGSHFSSIKLSDRESETLFFLMRGKRVTDIALFLSLSKRTVETYKARLFNKFTANSVSELVDNAISLGYMNMLPKNIFSSQLSRTLKY
jgi:PAS domain S-box-containing protein